MKGRALTGLRRWCGALALATGAAAAQPVAVLLDAGPGVSVKGEAGVARATLMHRLAAQDELRLAAASRAVLLMLSSGDEWQLEGPATARIERSGPVALSGHTPTRRSVPAGRELRVSPEKLVQGGLVLRAPPPPPVPTVAPEVIEQRRPPAGAPIDERIAFALWLESVDALAEAKAAWRALAAERPDEPALAARAR